MNRKLSIFLLLFLTSLFTFADEVSMSEAWNKAQPYIKTQSSMARAMRRFSGVSGTASQSQPLYIFSRGEGEGFVVVSGDDCLPAIIGYTEGGDYDEENMPPALKAIINHYAEAVTEAQAHGTNRPYSAVTASTYDKDISPLLTSHWHQSSPWNNLCPQRSDGGGRALTGCVATAASQIAYYWRNEGLNAVSQYDTPTYSYGDAPVTSVIVKAGTPFNWETMADNSTDVSGNAAMARLCVLMGTCAYLTYGASTGGYIWNMQDVFQNQIGMTRGEHVNKNDYSQVAWEKMVISDLVQGRPILYASYNKDKEGWDGHAYVVDGYKTSDNTFHINLGWGNGFDGYWTMAETTRDAMAGRPDDQSMVYKLYSQNMNRTFDIDVVGGAMYQNIVNKIAFSIENNSSMEVQGLYLFSSTSSSLPSSTKLENAMAYYEGNIKKGESIRDTVEYFTQYASSPGLYFFLTDKNLSVLYKTESPVPVQTSRAYLRLHSIQVENNGSEDMTFKYKGEEGVHIVYKVESSGMAMKANFSNDVTGSRGSTHCVPVFTAVVSSVDEDGNCTVVQTREERDTVFEVKDVKDIPFEFYDLEPNVLYKASISAKVGNGSGTLLVPLYYDTERADTMAFFMLTGSDMKVEREGGRVTVTGTTFDRLVYRGVARDASVTSIDLRGLQTDIPADIPQAANPNAIVYCNAPIQQSSNVVVDGVCENLRLLQGGGDYDPAADFKALKASMQIEGTVCTSSSYYWNTIILPFSAPTPVGMLARYYVDATRNTVAHADTMQAGTSYVYLMTHSIEKIEAENVDVYSGSGMPASIGYEGYIGTFYNMVTDGTQALSTGTAFAMAEGGVKIPAFTAYRTNAISLANMNSVRGVDVAMQSLAEACVLAREVLEQYRDERKEKTIATFEAAIYDAESLITALPAVYNDINNTRLALVAAQTAYTNPEPEYLRGDVNHDDEVNMGDLVSVSNFMAGDETVSEADADVNEDGEVNVGDLITISNIMAGNE